MIKAKDLAAFVVLMDAARNTYYSLLDQAREHELNTIDAVTPANDKHRAALSKKRKYCINKREKIAKDFERDMVGLIDKLKLSDDAHNECIEAGVDMVSDLMDKTFYSKDGMPHQKTGAYLLEQMKQKMFEEVDTDGNNVALNVGEVRIFVDAEVWKHEKGSCKGVEVRMVNGVKKVCL